MYRHKVLAIADTLKVFTPFKQNEKSGQIMWSLLMHLGQEKSHRCPWLAYDQVHRTVTGGLNEVPGIIVHEAHKGVTIDCKDLVAYINGPG